ncbi:MAG: D-alanine--D-alanine ligase family protein [Kiloniellales bacterium]|nr:D-alanine--D-alanine ligase family protein [Kiloniellales bacterium]
MPETNSKLRVAVLFGGRSAEHEVSLLSARNVAAALAEAGHEITLIAIGRSGRWYAAEEIATPAEADCAATRQLAVVPGAGRRAPRRAATGESLGPVDVVFPVLHGPFGEDGTVQGLLRCLDLPFVGPSVLGSAAAMDKDVAKRLLNAAGLPTAPGVTLRRSDPLGFADLGKALKPPFFVKPANLGSSVGVTRAETEAEFKDALALAFRYDPKVLVEEEVKGREIECAVLGTGELQASLPGEILPAAAHGFYTYDAKYIDPEGAGLLAPVELPAETTARVQETAVAAARALDCEGMARVDFFLKDDGALLINEINTIPGFTAISMYPKLWEVSGLPPAALVDRLLAQALARHEREQRLEVLHEV